MFFYTYKKYGKEYILQLCKDFSKQKNETIRLFYEIKNNSL